MNTRTKMPRHSDEALRSFFGARPDGQDRPQDVLTKGIALDPCANREAIVPADRYLYEAGEVADWPDRTFINPPYAFLEKWVKRLRRGHEHMLLAPVRANRAWMVRALSEATIQCWLKPFAFHGYTQSFPSPLAMVYYGQWTAAFREAFGEHGELVRVQSISPITAQEGLPL
jgi:hypothetical protein